MKRHARLTAKMPLKATTPLSRRTRMRRGGGLAPAEPSARNTPLRQQSTKRRRENRERSAMADSMFPGHTPPCAVPWCGQPADDLHEPLTRARGGPITDPDNAVPTCRRHNRELTGEPGWGYELHLLVHSWDRRTLAQIAEDRREALARWRDERRWEVAS